VSEQLEIKRKKMSH